jgi:ABC-type nickel/cobalt efflux system permease component RcnA
MRLGGVISGLLAVSWLIATGNAVAHPLGNFSVNQYSAIRIGKSEVELHYIVDMAEIPTFQEIQQTGLVPNVGDTSAEGYLRWKLETLRESLVLKVNGRKIALHSASREILFPEGAGGLPTMKIGVVYKGSFDGSAAARYELFYRDDNFPGRAGWKEIIASPKNGTALIESSVSSVDRSAQLSDYPTDLINSPPQVLEARLSFAPSAAETSKAQDPAGLPIRPLITDDELNIAEPIGANLSASAWQEVNQPPDPGLEQSGDSLQPNKQARLKNSFTELIAAKQLSWSIILLALFTAAVLGAFHALEPGHGKTLVAAYLVGSRGTMKHALILGVIVTAAHTAGVYLLGGATLYASQYIVPERLYPWLALLSGVLITALGLVLILRSYWNSETDSHIHHRHPHPHHSHSPDSGHSHHHGGHSHHHHDLSQEVSLRQLLTLGISGGIVPCPAALVVLLSALALNRVGFGLLLIVAFSIGLAVVLVGIGFLIVHARQFMSRFHGDGRLITRWLPLASSVFIILCGVALTSQAILSAGWIALTL